MNKVLAVCGLDCAACGAFIASKTNDDELRKKVAAEWAQAYGFAFTPEMINCHGCLAADGVQIGHCEECGMRLCAIGKKTESCGDCAEYPCKQVSDFHAQVPEAKANIAARA